MSLALTNTASAEDIADLFAGDDPAPVADEPAAAPRAATAADTGRDVFDLLVDEAAALPRAPLPPRYPRTAPTAPAWAPMPQVAPEPVRRLTHREAFPATIDVATALADDRRADAAPPAAASRGYVEPAAPAPAADVYQLAAVEDLGDPDAPPMTAAGRSARPLPQLLAIHEATIDLTPKSLMIDNEQTETDPPEDLAQQQFGAYGAAAMGGNDRVRFAALEYLWASPAMRHKPLYFEQANLERYGSACRGNGVASAAATGRFVAGALSLPYQMAAQPPSECVYTLGVYRPGSCNPHFVHVAPASGGGWLAQGAAVTGLLLLFP